MPHIVLNHPFICHKLSIIRSVDTHYSVFRKTIEEITMLMIPEIVKDITTKDINIQTPLQKTTGKKINQNIIVVPILRAGLGMSQAFATIIPEVKFGFIGLERDHDTHIPKPYYLKLPKIEKNDLIIITDPMLATGGSLDYSIKNIQKLCSNKIKIATIIASPEGIKHIEKQFPNINIYTASIDEGLTNEAYIFPGLGDVGDRIFGTEN